MKERKTPTRMCAGCRERKQKGELIRVVRDPAGVVSLDFTGKKPGRGAYICPKVGCLRMARKAKRLERSFSSEIPQEVYGELEGGLCAE